MPFKNIAVFGAGTMGHGIAQVCAMAGINVQLFDIDEERAAAGLKHIRKNLDKGVDRGKVAEDERDDAIERISTTTSLAEAAKEAEILIEAIPEKLELKKSLFQSLEEVAQPGVIFATNTSSISIAKIAEAVSDPSRVIGTHFFNPVHIMKLLEVVYHPGTGNDVIDAITALGEMISKECIVVRDVPGFATSRLGVALGMEAIRMLESGVASAEDIDKAMVLGYRHPIGPLKLTDLVGIDVRMHIGQYLARELNNPAFEPPELMKKLVNEGKLGKKTGEGFYRW